MTVLEQVSSSTTRRLGAIATRVQDVGHGGEQPLSVFLTDGVVPRSSRTDNHNELGNDLEKYQLVQPGDLVFNRLRAWQGGFGASAHRGVVSPAYIVVRPLGADARYLDYVLHSAPYLAELVRISKWMPPSQFDVLWSDLRQVPIPWLKFEEQRRIADFLDDRVACIDQIINARQTQASLIDELARSSKSRLIDDLIELHPVVPLRRFCAGIEQGSSPVAEDRPAVGDESGILKTSAIFQGTFRPDRTKVISADGRDPRLRVSVGDVLVVRGSGSADLVGDAAAVGGHFTQHLYLSDLTYRLTGLELIPEFAVLAITSARGRADLGSRVRQGSGPAKARGDDILSMAVPAASRSEQRRAAAEAGNITERADERSDQLRVSVSRLAEYKQSLITAAVTGELDVTTAGSGIPG